MNLLPKAALLLLLLLCLSLQGFTTSRLTYFNALGNALGSPITGTLNSLFTYTTTGSTIYAPRPLGTTKAVVEVLDDETVDRMIDVRVGILPLDLIIESNGSGRLLPVSGFPDAQVLRFTTPATTTPAGRILMVRRLQFGTHDTPYGIGLLVRAAATPFARVQVQNCVFEGFTVNAIYSQNADTELNISACRFTTRDSVVGLKQIRLSGNSTLPLPTLTSIQGCTFQVVLQNPTVLASITGVYNNGLINRNLFITGSRFEGFFSTAIVASQGGLGSVQVMGCVFDGPRPASNSGLPHSMIKGTNLSLIASVQVSYNSFRGVAENCVLVTSCGSATVQGNVISESGVTDASIALPSEFGIRRINGEPWSEQSIPRMFETYYSLYATTAEVESAMKTLVARQNAIMLTGTSMGTSLVTGNSILYTIGSAIYSICGDGLPQSTYRHVISNNLVSEALNNSFKISTSNTDATGNSIVNSSIDPLIFQELVDRWGCDQDGISRSFGNLFQYSCITVTPGASGTQHVRIANNVIQRAGNSILVEGTGHLSTQIPTDVKIHDNIIDTVLEPFEYHYTIDEVCQDSLKMNFHEWRSIWASDAQNISILRNRIHNGHVVSSHGEDWYVGGIGIQLDGTQIAEIRENVVDGVTCALVLATYTDSPGHTKYLRNVTCMDNVFNNIYGYSVPARTPVKTHWLSAFKMGDFNSRVDADLQNPLDFSQITVRRNTFIWNLDNNPTPETSPAMQYFSFTYPLRGPFPTCVTVPAPVHQGIDFRSNKGNLGGRTGLPLSDNYQLKVSSSGLTEACVVDYPAYTVAQQTTLYAELQAHNPGSLFSSALHMQNSAFTRTVIHPGFNENRIVQTLGGSESVPVVIPPYTTVTNP